MFKKIRNRQVNMLETHIEELVRKDHPYKKLLSIIDFSKFCLKGYGDTGLKPIKLL